LSRSRIEKDSTAVEMISVAIETISVAVERISMTPFHDSPAISRL